MHLPKTHASPELQALPQPPQLAGSTLVSTQLCPHCVVPPEHESAHVPFEHTSPGMHALPQLPQLSGSDAMLVHPAPHAVWPVVHVEASPVPPLLLLHP